MLLQALVLVNVAGQLCHKGALTPWDREGVLQRTYRHFPQDAFSVGVAAVAACCMASPREAIHRRTGTAWCVADAKPSANHGLFPYWLHVDEATGIPVRIVGSEATVTAGDAMRQWGLNMTDEDIEGIPCVPLPLAICELIVRGEWTTILCLSRWEMSLRKGKLPRPFGDWPDLDWCRSKAGLHDVLERELPTASSLALVEGKLRELCSSLAIDECNETLSSVVEQVERWRRTMAEAAGRHNLHTADGKFSIRYSASMLIECLRLCRSLKGGARRLAFVIERALGIVSEAQGYCLSCIPQSMELPSPATLHRYELCLDVAMMVQRSEALATASVKRKRWMWTDSSPQKSYDWVWAEFHEVEESLVLSTFRGVLKLTAVGDALPSDPETLNCLCASDVLPEEWFTSHDCLKT